MNYTSYIEFKSKLMEDAKNLAADVIGREAEVFIEEDDFKGHRTEVLYIRPTREFLQLNRRGYGCAIELRSAYEEYLRHPAWAGLIRALRRQLEEIDKLPKELDLGILGSFKLMRDRLFLAPIPLQEREKAETEICKLIDDIPMAVYFVIANDKKGRTVARIPSKILKQWNVSKEEVLTAAVENQMKAAKAVLTPMCDLIPLIRMFIRNRKDEYMYVGTTERKTDGAVVISYPGFLDKACEEIGEDVFVFPSSIHEVVLVKESYMLMSQSVDEADDFLKYVNGNRVAEEDVLSDKVYHYERATKTFEAASAWYQRVNGTDL